MEKKQILIKCDEALKERLAKSAEKNKRSVNKQAQHLLEEALLFDEKFHSLLDDQKFLVLKTVRDIIEKLS